MKKNIMRSICLLLLLTFSFSVTTLATGNVTYDCGEHVFLFESGNDEFPTDLFSELKDVMPGDTVNQVIRIRNSKKSNMNSKIYLRSLGSTEEGKAFLSQLSMQISTNGGEELFDAAPNEKAQLKDWVYLGMLEPGADVELYLTLSVPMTLEDEYQDSLGCVQWEFRSEEISIEEEGPKTGDNYRIVLYVLLTIVSVAYIIVMVCRNRKGK